MLTVYVKAIAAAFRLVSFGSDRPHSTAATSAFKRAAIALARGTQSNPIPDAVVATSHVWTLTPVGTGPVRVATAPMTAELRHRQRRKRWDRVKAAILTTVSAMARTQSVDLATRVLLVMEIVAFGKGYPPARAVAAAVATPAAATPTGDTIVDITDWLEVPPPDRVDSKETRPSVRMSVCERDTPPPNLQAHIRTCAMNNILVKPFGPSGPAALPDRRVVAVGGYWQVTAHANPTGYAGRPIDPAETAVIATTKPNPGAHVVSLRREAFSSNSAATCMWRDINRHGRLVHYDRGLFTFLVRGTTVVVMSVFVTTNIIAIVDLTAAGGAAGGAGPPFVVSAITFDMHPTTALMALASAARVRPGGHSGLLIVANNTIRAFTLSTMASILLPELQLDTSNLLAHCKLVAVTNVVLLVGAAGRPVVALQLRTSDAVLPRGHQLEFDALPVPSPVDQPPASTRVLAALSLLGDGVPIVTCYKVPPCPFLDRGAHTSIVWHTHGTIAPDWVIEMPPFADTIVAVAGVLAPSLAGMRCLVAVTTTTAAKGPQVMPTVTMYAMIDNRFAAVVIADWDYPTGVCFPAAAAVTDITCELIRAPTPGHHPHTRGFKQDEPYGTIALICVLNGRRPDGNTATAMYPFTYVYRVPTCVDAIVPGNN
jgi:hypothetical protein